jgi:DNA-binding PadR family transcriptional regulator
MNLSGDILRGYTDMLLLSILNEKDSYGYQVNQILQEKTKGEFSLTEATLYTSFKRLAEQDYILSYWLQTENQKKRKYYSITSKGKKFLTRKKKEWVQAKQLIDHVIQIKKR